MLMTSVEVRIECTAEQVEASSKIERELVFLFSIQQMMDNAI